MIEVEWWEFDDPETLAKEVAGDVGFIIEKATEQNGKAELALPGGAAAIVTFETLAARDLEWAKVRVFPIAERIAPASGESGNHEMLKRIFGKAGATAMPLIDGDRRWNADEAGRSADARLAGLSWPIDLVWLDMAEDGSVAAISPGDMDAAINAPRGRRAVGVNVPDDRVTLTREALLGAHALIITIAGDARRATLERAIRDGPLSSLPIGRVLAEAEMPIDIYWSAT